MRIVMALTALLAISSFLSPASAQEARRIGRGQPNMIQTSVALSLPVNLSKPREEQYEDGLRSLYRVAARSCVIVLETVAKSCEIVSISNSVQTDTQRVVATGLSPRSR